MLTFTRDEWNHLLRLLNIHRCPLVAISFFQTESKSDSSMAKRGPEGTSGEGSAMAKPKYMNLVMAKPRLVNLVPLKFV